MAIQKCSRCGGQIIDGECLQCGYSPPPPPEVEAKQQKGRPEKLTDELKLWIAKYQGKQKKKLKATDIRDVIYYSWVSGIPEDLPTEAKNQVMAIITAKMPGISAIQKFTKMLNEKLDKPSELDITWHLGLMGKYNIPAEALPYILMVQRHTENSTDMFGQPHEPLTIRQALWVSRLYGIITPNPKVMKKDPQKMLYSIAHYLYQCSEAYATREKICQLSGTPFDTTSLDKALRDGAEFNTFDKTIISSYRKDQSFSIDTIDEKLTKQMEQMKKDGEQ